MFATATRPFLNQGSLCTLRRRTCAAGPPKRVGTPKQKPSAFGRSATLITGSADLGGACIILSTSSGSVSGTCSPQRTESSLGGSGAV